MRPLWPALGFALVVLFVGVVEAHRAGEVEAEIQKEVTANVRQLEAPLRPVTAPHRRAVDAERGSDVAKVAGPIADVGLNSPNRSATEFQPVCDETKLDANPFDPFLAWKTEQGRNGYAPRVRDWIGAPLNHEHAPYEHVEVAPEAQPQRRATAPAIRDWQGRPVITPSDRGPALDNVYPVGTTVAMAPEG